ncbi:MAG: UDP-3-O-(3-hydroxymyristoyl)glucosamine N-acyltransferase [Alphaproteobacteria bacterium]|jgi:UDP-3-O-[3-hydroxymyristoyl] glucosamine N-acyltransferase|nr:UDP-3-O-(3-hydroxymyristoyl)glucosamine N-acyltransferase [Candidatus Jidaibacter sp.]
MYFKKTPSIKLSELANISKSELKNCDSDIEITNVATLANASSGQISFFNNPKYLDSLISTNASACIVDEAQAEKAPKNVALLINKNPYAAYAKVVSAFYPDEEIENRIEPSAHVHPTANVSTNCYIGHNAVIDAGVMIEDGCYIGASSFIGRDVKIGKQTKIMPNSTIVYARIGKNCLIYSGVRIGQDGFGFAPSDMGLLKVKQIGLVIIGDNVEIGANTTIDRGAIEDTVIGNGTKIDNQVQIGHNCVIGNHCVICGQVGLAGSSKIDDMVMLGGQVGVAGHLTIGAGSKIAAQSGIISDVEPKSILGGSPAIPIRDWHKATAVLKSMLKKKKSEIK